VAFGVIAAVLGAMTVHRGWDDKRARMRSVGVALDLAAVPATDRLLSIDAAGYRYWTGRGGVVLVNDPLDTVQQVADAYDLRWLVLERGDTVPAAEAVLAGERPWWIGPPILEREDVGVYPLCRSVEDPRCVPS
jgi:hypothetical protein